MRPVSPRILLALTALFSAPQVGLAQNLPIGGSEHLPTSNISSDHSVTAINSEGDIFVVWQEVVSPGKHEVWGAFFDYVGNGNWARPQQHLRIGESSVLVGAGNPTCKKPDVVAAGTDFLIVWSIYDRSLPTNRGHLQAAKVDSQGVVHQPAPGEGYRVSDDFWVGDTGATVSLADWSIAADGSTQTSHGLVVYIEHISRTTIASGDINEYRVRGVQFDFGAASPTWSHVTTAQGDPWIADGLAADALDTFASGSRVPPSILQDLNGELIIAIEEFRHEKRGISDHRGHVWMLRYAIDAAGQSTPTAQLQLHGTVRADSQRRPHLAMAALGTDNRVGVSWLELDSHGEQGRANSAVLDITPSGFELLAQSSYDGYGTHEVLDSRTSPELHYVLGVHDPLPGTPGPQELFAWSRSMPSAMPIAQNVVRPRRPGWASIKDLPDTLATDPVYAQVIDDSFDVFLTITD